MYHFRIGIGPGLGVRRKLQRRPVFFVIISLILFIYFTKYMVGDMLLIEQSIRHEVLVETTTAPEVIAVFTVIPFNMGLFTFLYDQLMPELRRLKTRHKIAYNPLNHTIVSDQVRTTLSALDCWEKIHTVADKHGNERYINDLEANLELEKLQEQLGDKFEFDLAEYIEYSEYVHSLEQNVFHWATKNKNMSVLQLKHSFKDKRGLVTTMGNDQFYSGYGTLKMLRDRGCTLPFEIFYVGEGDLKIEYRNKLSTLSNTTIVDLTEYISEDLSGFSCKPFIMLFSSFREIVFMDSDALFLQPAERVFTQPLYIQHGALFFLDRSIGDGRNEDVIKWMDQLIAGHNHISSQKTLRSRYMLGLTDHTQESGVVVIDKKRHFGALLSVCQLNRKDERTVSYKYVYGDKETFWLGFEMAGDSNWAFSSFIPGALGSIELGNENFKYPRVCSSKIVHFDFMGKPFWFNGGILRNKYVDDVEKVFEDFSYWATEPGEWELLEGNIACLNSDRSPVRIANDSDIAEWLDSHKQAFREIATSLPLIQLSS